LGVSGEEVDVTVIVGVDTSGVTTLEKASAKCSGSTCPNTGVDVIDITKLNLDGILVPAPERDCVASVKATVSKEN
jgi:hypothetical protein